MSSKLNSAFASLMMRQFGGGDEPFFMDLIQSARDGHLCMKRKTPPSLPTAALYHASEMSDLLFPLEPIVRFHDWYYLQRNWVYETHICQHIRRLSKCFCEKPIQLTEKQREGLTPLQAEAVERALNSPLTVISGGPGTGKTYTAGQIIRILSELYRNNLKNRDFGKEAPQNFLSGTNDHCRKQGMSEDKNFGVKPMQTKTDSSGCFGINVKPLYKVCITAPTGKAAQHLRNGLSSLEGSIDIRADTLHRLLGLTPGASKLFSGFQIDADVIIVDEASMIDVDLWAHLLEAVSDQTKLILMGDPDQLPPVEAGSIFSDLSDLFAVRLRQCMRTDKRELQEFSAAIQQGNMDGAMQCLQAGLGVFSPIDPKQLYDKLSIPLFSTKPDPCECLQEFQRTKILGALRQGPLGIDRLNALFLEFYKGTFRKGHFWAVPILISSNAPHLGLYNGSSGVLMGSCDEGFNPERATAYFFDPLSEAMRSFVPSILPSYELAFCLSVHKSQGSEFDHVFALFPPGSEKFGREALYTAATRSRKSLQIAIAPSTLEIMLGQCFRKQSNLVERVIVI
ncbi:MAG: AAA family ATPase [Chlamydiales bacterium]|nr:AAA family ATPase [Chlamydiales bacterium]